MSPVWEDDFGALQQCCFYAFQWAFTVIGLEEVRGMNLRDWFPSVVAFWVSLPFDEVLQRFRSSVMSMTDDALDFKLLFAINQIRRWAREVWSVSGCFVIGR
jgi:hypothetical protein